MMCTLPPDLLHCDLEVLLGFVNTMINQELSITELAFIFYAAIKTSGIFDGYIAHLCINLPYASAEYSCSC